MKSKKYFIIYKLIRNDGQIYIGTTNNQRFKNRMYVHKKSKRFKNYKFQVNILKISCDENILNDEEKYITLFDSYKNGLNNTWSGKGYGHNSLKFTTLGYKFSDETKNKISKSNKKRFIDNPELRSQISKRQKKYFSLPETKNKMSKIRKGKQHSTKLNDSQVKEILNLYYNIKPNINGVNVIQKNGKPMSYIQLFSKTYNKKYKVTTECIKNIIMGKSWLHVQKEFKI